MQGGVPEGPGLRNTAVVYLLTYVLSFSRYQQTSAITTSTAKVENISKDRDGGQEKEL